MFLGWFPQSLSESCLRVLGHTVRAFSLNLVSSFDNTSDCVVQDAVQCLQQNLLKKIPMPLADEFCRLVFDEILNSHDIGRVPEDKQCIIRMVIEVLCADPNIKSLKLYEEYDELQQCNQFDGQTLFGEPLFWILRLFPQIQHLILGTVNPGVNEEEVVEGLKSMKNLKSFKCYGCTGKVVSALGENCKNLEHVKLECYRRKDWKSIMDLSNCKNIQKLSLQKFGDAGSIAFLILRLPKLEELVCDNINFVMGALRRVQGDSAIQSVNNIYCNIDSRRLEDASLCFPHLQNVKVSVDNANGLNPQIKFVHLQRLTLVRMKCDAPSILPFVRVNSAQLLVLDISGSRSSKVQINKSDLDVIAKSCPLLHTLSLHDVNFNEHKLVPTIECSITFHALKSFSVYLSDLHDSFFPVRCPNLKNLRVSDIRDVKSCLIEKFLEINPLCNIVTLRIEDISQNNLCVGFVRKILETCNNLEFMNININCITDNELESLMDHVVNKCPHLHFSVKRDIFTPAYTLTFLMYRNY